ncbi:MAG: 4Fe-4S binding protein [Promethearchaeota archaeon]
MSSEEQVTAGETEGPRDRIGRRFSEIKQSLLERTRPHKTLHYWVKRAFDELLAIRIIRCFVQLISFILLNFAAITWALGYNPLLYSPLSGVGWLIPLFGFIPLPYVMPHGNPAATGVGFFDILMLFSSAGIFPYIAIGVLLIVPALVGRSFCGWVCPFGFVQDLLSLSPIRTRYPSRGTDAALAPIKYVILGITLLVVTWLGVWTFLGIEEDLATTLGSFSIAFWSVLSPAATFFVIIPWLYLTNQISPFITEWHKMLAWQPIIWIRLIFLSIIILLALFVRRPYCRWFCPAGALLGLVGQFSLLGISRRPAECPGSSCDSQRCQNECPMGIRVMEAPWGRLYSRRCILCLDCLAKCEHEAIKVDFP